MHQFLTEELEKIDEIYSSFIIEITEKNAKFIIPGKDVLWESSVSKIGDLLELTKRLYDGAKKSIARAEEEGFQKEALQTVAEEVSALCKKYHSDFWEK